MSIDITGIRTKRIEYRQPDPNEFFSLNEYLEITKKIVKRFAGQIVPGLHRRILSSDDALANIAHQIMMADWRWDEGYRSNDGKVRTKYCYRNQCGIWAIKEYVKRSTKAPKIQHVEASKTQLRKEFSVKDDQDAGMTEVEDRARLETIIEKSNLSDQEMICIQMRLENFSFKEMSKLLKVPKSYILTLYNDAVKKMQEV